MNHDEILEMLRRSGVEVPGGSERSAEEPIDVEVEWRTSRRESRRTLRAAKHPSPPASARRPARAKETAARGEHVHKGRPVPPFMEKLADWSRTALIVALIALGIAALVSYWWFHPALNIHSPRVWSWIILVAIFAVVALKVVALRSARHATLFNRLGVRAACGDSCVLRRPHHG